MREDEMTQKIDEIASQIDLDLFNPKSPESQIFKFFKQVQSDIVLKQLYQPLLEGLKLETSTGFFLDNLAAHWCGVLREPALKTKGQMRVFVERSLNLSQDMIFKTASGTEFRIIKSTPIEKPSALVTIEAIKAGVDGNLMANTPLEPQRVIGGFKRAIVEAGWMTQVGQDEETDERVRLRIKTANARKALGDLSSKYIARAEEITNVRNAVVWRTPRGAGSADIVIAANDGIVSDAMLREVREYLNEWGQVGWDISVAAAKKEALRVQVVIRDTQLTQEAVREVIEKYSLSLPIGGVFQIKDVYERLNYGVNILSPIEDIQAEQYSEWSVAVTFGEAQTKTPQKEYHS